MEHYLLFSIDRQKYALRLHAVERAIRAAEITPLPNAPDIILGIINIGGRIIPVVNLRKRLGLPEKEISLSDQFIVARTSNRRVALVADEVTGVAEKSEADVVAASAVAPGIPYVQGIMKLAGEIILIHDLDLFLSLDEALVLDKALRGEK